MAQFTIYRSVDASAPVLTGQVGSLIGLLDACLVNGYGSKSPAGWSKAFTGTNQAAYRQGSGSQFYMFVHDQSTTYGWFVGYEVMTSISAGTGRFPTTTQFAAAQSNSYTGMLGIRKSASADSIARAWIVVADSRTVYLFVLTNDTASIYHSSMFGDIYSLGSSDAYSCMIIGRDDTYSSPLSAYDRFGQLSVANAAAATYTYAGHYMARSYSQAGSSIPVGKHGDGLKGGFYGVARGGFSGIIPYPNGTDGGICISSVHVTEGDGSVRGRMRGLYQWLHNVNAGSDGTTFTAASDYAGREFLLIGPIESYEGSSSIYRGYAVIETSDTLETN